ncbi:hypothetical protein G6031_08705 [Dietzia sp. CQ4]|uniref:hypothetical protein n=1 Tax=Dietzia sp. (strain CQ4) TaxID=370437 RepID=UPI0015FD2BCC|nr:hypothetical protein [Dietzia sp. CQ4]MBB1034468.1 hypothetical protein [Dietzia sp. CQ4]
MTDETEGARTADLPATVKVTGPGVSIERGVDERTMNAVIGLLVGVPVPRPGGGDPAGSSGGGGGGMDEDSGGRGLKWDERMTLGEFLDDSGAKTFPHKICATGFYLTAIKGATDFNRDEVRSALLAAREDMPGNYARDWATATNLSLIAPEGHDATRFYIPRTGKKAIDSNFEDTPKPRRTRKSTKKASSNGGAE